METQQFDFEIRRPPAGPFPLDVDGLGTRDSIRQIPIIPTFRDEKPNEITPSKPSLGDYLKANGWEDRIKEVKYENPKNSSRIGDSRIIGFFNEDPKTNRYSVKAVVTRILERTSKAFNKYIPSTRPTEEQTMWAKWLNPNKFEGEQKAEHAKAAKEYKEKYNSSVMGRTIHFDHDRVMERFNYFISLCDEKDVRVRHTGDENSKLPPLTKIKIPKYTTEEAYKMAIHGGLEIRHGTNNKDDLLHQPIQSAETPKAEEFDKKTSIYTIEKGGESIQDVAKRYKPDASASDVMELCGRIRPFYSTLDSRTLRDPMILDLRQVDYRSNERKLPEGTKIVIPPYWREKSSPTK